MNHWTMEIPGPIMGAVRTTQRAKCVSPTYKRYVTYKDTVRTLANAAGFPSEPKKDGRYGLSLEIFWKRKARADTDNVLKGCLDALFKQDRRILSIRAWANEFCKYERAIVTLEWMY